MYAYTSACTEEHEDRHTGTAHTCTCGFPRPVVYYPRNYINYF